MGWSGGTYVMQDIIGTVQEHIDNEDVRCDLYIGIIEALQMSDWDCAGECLGDDPAYDRALEMVRRAWCKKRGHSYEDWYGEDA